MRPTARCTVRRLAIAAAAVACGTGTGACDSGRSVPEQLADGTPPRLSKVVLEDVDVPVIATNVGSLPEEPPVACADPSRSVDRVSVAGASRTSPASSAPELRACDWTVQSGWCGDAFALLRIEQSLDPRLSVTCRGADGKPLGFLWVRPGRNTAFVVVTGRDYAEAYPVVRGAPVRVTTERVDLATSSATVEASEHARDGRLLRVRRIEAQVSG